MATGLVCNDVLTERRLAAWSWSLGVSVGLVQLVAAALPFLCLSGCLSRSLFCNASALPGLCVASGWVRRSTLLHRISRVEQHFPEAESRCCMQDMSYTKQLDQYEEAVMNKRLEEMPEAERERLYAEIEDERQKRLQKQQKS